MTVANGIALPSARLIRQGNTAKVLGWIETQFLTDGHEVD